MRLIKSKSIILVILVVLVAHLAAYFILSHRTEPAPGDADYEAVPAPRTVTLPADPIDEVPDSESAESTASESVSNAVSLIQKAEAAPPRATQPPAPDEAVAIPAPEESPPDQSPKAPKAEDSPPSPNLTLGIVKGPSKLPPELSDLAQEGAKALASQDLKKAQNIYRQMVKAAPENALVYANLGVVEQQLGNSLAASGNLKKSLSLNPTIAENWKTLGIIQYERKELALALSSLLRAVHEEPTDASYRLDLATVLRAYGWLEASITELEHAIEIDPKSSEAQYNLAVSYLDVKPPRMELARRHYYLAIDLGAPPSTDVEGIFAQHDRNLSEKTNE